LVPSVRPVRPGNPVTFENGIVVGTPVKFDHGTISPGNV